MTDGLASIDSLSKAKYDIELFLSGGDFDLFEDRAVVGLVECQRAAVEVSFGKLIFSCWTDNWSRSWRVLRSGLEAGRLRLECTRQMGRTACTVTLSRDGTDLEGARTRAEFASMLGGLIEREMPGLKVARANVGRLDQRHLRGIHVRLVIKDRRATVAGIGISEREAQPAIDSALAAGIVWFDDLRKKVKSLKRLMIFAPRGRAATLATRLCALNPPGASVSLFEVSERDQKIEPVVGFDQGDLLDRLRKASQRTSRRAQWPRERRLDPAAQSLINSVVLLAPDDIEQHQRGAYVLLSIRGLEFARVSIARRCVEFGLGARMVKLDDGNRRQLAGLIDEILMRRTSDPPDRGEVLFRAQAERWLESAILRDVTAIDSTLDPRHVYSQVPAYRGEQRSYIDLLSATRRGRLVVIELKVSEDPDFPLQGLDYWLRVEWHRRRGDFERRGYFNGLKLADQPPLLYLVAPVFRFHATTKLISSWTTGQAPVYRVGINEDWRSGVNVLLLEKLNS